MTEDKSNELALVAADDLALTGVEDPEYALESGDEALYAYLKAQRAELFRSASVFRVRVAGEAELDGEKIPYRLVPPDGTLMKANRWKKTRAADRLALVEARINSAALRAMQWRVEDFLRRTQLLAGELDLDPRDFWPALMTDGHEEVSRFQTIVERMQAAHERLHEVRSAARAKAAINLSDYPESFPAVALPRKFVALLGPTNSGKTHRAIEALKCAQSGVYLAPLRLLANENYERLDEAGVPVSLITGEERKLHPNATHFASTVEMLDPNRAVDVAVVDEVQMLEDADRGSAWTAAVCGVPAQTVYLLGSPTAEPALRALAQRLAVPLEIEHLERKAPLEVESKPLAGLNALRRGDALIAFSRRDVLFLARQLSQMGRSVATIYGALSPEARRAQARRFESGEVDIVVATDAIGMGLNLPIQRIVFSRVTKFDGYEEDFVPRALLHQISGRAGRFGLHEAGRVAALDERDHRYLQRELRVQPEALEASQFQVAPSLEHLRALQEATGEHSLEKLLQRFVKNLDLRDDFFVPANLTDQLARAPILDRTRLSLDDRVVLSLVPINTEVVMLDNAWRGWVFAMSKGQVTRFRDDVQRFGFDLQQAEDMCRLCAAYSWLSYRRPDAFPDGQAARDLAVKLSALIDQLLAHRHGARGSRGRDDAYAERRRRDDREGIRPRKRLHRRGH
ncbi:MAG TPA: helicase-related protein [Burkholderiales bacterium]|nr:helicase-related protein [Burkholderiales bacterium]